MQFKQLSKISSILLIIATLAAIFIITTQAPMANATFVTSSTLTIDGTFTDWGNTTIPTGGTYWYQDQNGGPSDGSGFAGTSKDMNYIWTAIATKDGGSAIPNASNPIQYFYYRVDTFSTSTISGQAYNIQLNLGNATSGGYADHLLQIYVDTGQVSIVLYQYNTPYPTMRGFTTGALVGKVSNVANPFSGFATGGGVVDANATGAQGKYDGTNYGVEVKIPVSWFGSTYGGNVKSDGTGARTIVGAIFTSTGSLGSVGTVKDVFGDATKDRMLLTSPTTGSTTFPTTSIAQLGLITTAQNITAGTSSSQITVQTQMATGESTTVTGATTINLASNSTTGRFETASNGTFTSSSLNVTISAGSNSTSFYYKDTTTGHPTITATEMPTQNWTAATQTEQINPASLDHYTISNPTSGTAGQSLSGSVVVTAYDVHNNIKTDYTGMVYFTSTDSKAILPHNSTSKYTFLTSDNGQHTFAGSDFILKTAGTQTITVTDGSGHSKTTGNISISPAAASSIVISGYPSSVTAGSAQSFTATAYDAYNNTATGYTGVLHFTSNDTGATLPSDSTLTSGVGTFSATLTLAGTKSITATDNINGALTNTKTTTVTPSTATHFTVTSGTTQVAGTPFNVVVTAKDAYENTATGYTGTVNFTSSDSNTHVSLPADYTFVSGDSGTKTRSATLATVGTQSITAEDTLSPSISGSQTEITVTHGAVATIEVASTSSSVITGSARTYTATAYDTCGNSWDVTSSTTWSISEGAGGSWSSNVYTSENTGEWTVTGTYGGQPYTTTLTVNLPGIMDHFIFDTIGSQVAGSSFSVTIRAVDAGDNPASSYTGTPTLSYSDGTITPTSITEFSSSVWTGAVTVTTAGSLVTLSVTDETYSGESNEFTVTHAAAVNHLSVSLDPATITAGEEVTGTATAYDAYNNPWDVSNSAAWSVPAGGDGGSWTDNTYTTHTAGTFSVKAEYSGKNATNSLTVIPDSLSYIVVSPLSVNVTAGSTQAFTSEGFDQFDNSLGAVSATYTCTGATVTENSVNATSVGTYTVTATYGAVSADAILYAEAGTLDHFVIDTITAQNATGAFTVTINAVDKYGNIVTGYTGSNTLASSVGSISPTTTGAFVNGVWSGIVSVSDPSSNLSITTSGATKMGTSNSFIVNPVIIASAGAHGSISNAGSLNVGYGGTQVYSVSPDLHYHIADVLVDGTSVGAVTTYSFTDGVVNHNITASFTIDTYTLTPTAGSGGSISPNTPQTVNYGNSQSFTITANAHYHVTDVLVDGSSVGAVSTYAFEALDANHTLSASFAIDTFNITVTSGAGGSITPTSATKNYGDNQQHNITVDTGYHIVDVLVDGVSQGNISNYTFSFISTNHTISATFAINTYEITLTKGEGGSVSPSSSPTVNFGDNQTFTITKDVGYRIVDVVVDGSSVGIVTSYTFSNVTSNHSIAVTFAKNAYIITVTAGKGGSISPASTGFDYGNTQQYIICTDTGYHIVDVLVDDASVGNVTTYTFNNIGANHTISASFAKDTFNITIAQPSNGAISPSTLQTIEYGDNQTFTIIPDTGFHVADVQVDGSSIGAVISYTLSNITQPHNITATFALNTYRITISAGNGGTISPNSSDINYGENQTFIITPYVHYHIVDVLVDDQSQGPISSVTFNNIKETHSITASFALDSFAITVIGNTGGSISPSTSQTVSYGWDQSFTIAPDTGYHIVDVIVDDSSVGAVTDYSFANVTCNHTISVSFALNTYSITVTVGTGGSISPSPATVNYGDTQEFIITPDNGYRIADVIVDGVSQGNITSYNFTNIQDDHTISATFESTNTIVAIKTTNNEIYTVKLSGNITAQQMTNLTITPYENTSSTIVAFTVTGPSGQSGYGSIILPIAAIPFGTQPLVYIDGVLAENQTCTQDGEYYYISYTTHFSTHEITIEFTTLLSAIPTPIPTPETVTEFIQNIIPVNPSPTQTCNPTASPQPTATPTPTCTPATPEPTTTTPTQLAMSIYIVLVFVLCVLLFLLLAAWRRRKNDEEEDQP